MPADGVTGIILCSQPLALKLSTRTEFAFQAARLFHELRHYFVQVTVLLSAANKRSEEYFLAAYPSYILSALSFKNGTKSVVNRPLVHREIK